MISTLVKKASCSDDPNNAMSQQYTPKAFLMPMMSDNTRATTEGSCWETWSDITAKSSGTACIRCVFIAVESRMVVTTWWWHRQIASVTVARKWKVLRKVCEPAWYPTKKILWNMGVQWFWWEFRPRSSCYCTSLDQLVGVYDAGYQAGWSFA